MRKRLFRIVASGVLVTFAGWILFGIMIIVLDDGGTNEHAPRTILEFVFNTLWAILQWPYLFLRFFPDYYSELILAPLTAFSVAFWGVVCELVWWRIDVRRGGVRAVDSKIAGAIR